MAEVSDEVLMAYADGALDPADRAIVEAVLKERPDYREKLEKFRATGTPVRQALLEGVDRGRLAALAARIRRGEKPPAIAARDGDGAKVVTLASRQTPRSSTVPRSYWPTAMAASLALLVGGGFGWFVHGSPTPMPMQPTSPDVVSFRDGNLEADGALARLLETAGSGTAVAANGAHGRSWGLKALFSFRSVVGWPCRRYELSSETSQFAGYACRSTNGRWLVHAHLELRNELHNKPPTTEFTPAGADNDGALDAAIRAVMDGDVLQLSEESKLIAGHWTADSK